MSLFDDVIAYSQLGYVCVPVNIRLDGKGNKVVDMPPWKGRKFYQPEDWEGFTGIAFNAEASGLVAVDIDCGAGKDGFEGLAEAGIELPDTPIKATTRSGGQHFLYRQGSTRVKSSASVLARDVDIRAEGGLLFVFPTEVIDHPEQKYRWQAGTRSVPVSELPEFPEELARRLTIRQARTAVAGDDFTPAQVTAQQREWALRKIDLKLKDIAEAKAGERNSVLGRSVPRIVGLVKTLGEDVEAFAEKIKAAYAESGGEDEQQVDGWIESSIRFARPENPLNWLPVDRQRWFWDARPELRQIRQAAWSGMASPWAVLGALCVRVLADVPPSHRIITGIGDPNGGNLNLYAVLAAESGGGKGVASQVARHLWPSEVYCTEIASGEALPRLFARRGRDQAGEYYTEQIRESVIIDAPEFGSLSASGRRDGATLTQRLCNGFSGEGLSFAVADESKNIDVRPNSYRLGVITGIQYGNAGLLLGEASTVTGLPQRFVWFPANVAPEEIPDTRPEIPAPLSRWNFPQGGSRIEVCEEARRDIEAAQRAKLTGDTSVPLDGHALYARVKVAYALAVLSGHYDSVRAQDWELSGIVMEASDQTRQRAVDTLKVRDRKAAQAAGKREGIRKAQAAETEANELHTKIKANVLRHLEATPGGLSKGGRDGLGHKLRSGHRQYLDDVLAELVAEGKVEVTDDWVRSVG